MRHSCNCMEIVALKCLESLVSSRAKCHPCKFLGPLNLLGKSHFFQRANYSKSGLSLWHSVDQPWGCGTSEMIMDVTGGDPRPLRKLQASESSKKVKMNLSSFNRR